MTLGSFFILMCLYHLVLAKGREAVALTMHYGLSSICNHRLSGLTEQDEHAHCTCAAKITVHFIVNFIYVRYGLLLRYIIITEIFRVA